MYIILQADAPRSEGSQVKKRHSRGSSRILSRRITGLKMTFKSFPGSRSPKRNGLFSAFYTLKYLLTAKLLLVTLKIIVAKSSKPKILKKF